MSNQTEQQNLSSFNFPTIFYGIEASVAVVANERQFGVLLNGEFVAQLELNKDSYTWFVASGELNDHDLVNEIGSRIEAIYH